MRSVSVIAWTDAKWFAKGGCGSLFARYEKNLTPEVTKNEP